MSGGISGIKGYDYQAIVILSRLFDHFEQFDATASARPEGSDDLDLSWTADGVVRRRHEQIKKPTEDLAGNLNPTPWTVAKAISELLPNTISHLSNGSDIQVWILGDAVAPELRSLVAAGKSGPVSASKAYWKVVHGLARNEAVEGVGLAPSIRRKLARKRVSSNLPSDPAQALEQMAAQFGDLSDSLGAGAVAAHYRRKISELHARLPDVIARTQILENYGAEHEVATRVLDRLEQTYSLQRSVVEHCLFRNLTGFINDIAKQPGRRFDREEFEFELKSIWPQMLPIREPLALGPDHVARRSLTDRFTTGWTGNALEMIGISGSGKTMLAAEVIEKSRDINPDRLVYYAQVREGVSLRDVLVGVAFHLRRFNIKEPFSVSVEGGPTEEEILGRLARVYSTLPQAVTVLTDLVDGTCSQAFARDLATFIRALPSSDFRIAVLGQESALRELTAAERTAHSVTRLDLRGFDFEEFVTLVRHHHKNPDRANLKDIHQRVTAGRPAGLFAKLADSLARSGSLEEMSAMAARPPDEMLPHAEQQRFARISGGARSAAEKLVCFALAFRQRDAEEVFPDDNVGAAIREMLTQGLLRPYDAESFEMHETVRAGLEGTIAPATRRTAHAALAVWYGRQGLTTAEILHLEKAGRSSDAERLAREAFLRGEYWTALAAYVTGRNLVSVGELINTMAAPIQIQDQYLLSSILHDLNGPSPVEELLRVLHEQPQRFVSNYQWGLTVVEAILDFDPERLHDVLIFALGATGDDAQRDSALNWVLHAARRANSSVDSRTVTFFNGQPPQIKRLLLRFLLLGPRRETIGPALRFLADDPGAADELERRAPWRGLTLQIGGEDNAIEFLAAMPAVETPAMVTARSVLLGPLAKLIWVQRVALRSLCIDVLRDGGAEEIVLVNALRILVFLGETSVLALSGPFMSRNDRLGVFARFVPALLPLSCDFAVHERRFFDLGAPLEDRMMALFTLAGAGVELGKLFSRVRATETDPKKIEAWEQYFLMLCIQSPFAEAIPLLEDRLKTADAQKLNLLIPGLIKLGELASRSQGSSERNDRPWTATVAGRPSESRRPKCERRLRTVSDRIRHSDRGIRAKFIGRSSTGTVRFTSDATLAMHLGHAPARHGSSGATRRFGC
jgi:hypothetical protein